MTKRILIVEDDLDLRDSLQQVLQAEGWTVYATGSKAEALAVAREHKPPVALVDVALPDGMGTELIPAMREIVPGASCVVVTGQADVDSAITALELGASAYLRKPVQPAELIHGLERIWDGHELLRRQLASQAALQTSEARYRLLADNSTDLISLHSLDGTFLYASPASWRLLATEPEQLQGANLFERAHSDDRPLLHAALERARLDSTGSVVAYRIHRNDGEELWVESSLRMVKEQGVSGKRFSASTRDVSSRKQYESDLKRAKEAAEQANRSKSEFLANMSHEIRTPMNAIIGLTQIVLDGPLTEQQRHHLKLVREAGDLLLSIINDVLDVSRIEAGKFDLADEEFNLSEVLRGVVAALSPQADAKGLQLHLNEQFPADLQVRSDSVRLRQVLFNLVSNAIKFTDQGTVDVEVDVQQHDLMLRMVCTVRDTGIGIAPDRVQELFRSYGQLEGSTTRTRGGSGLGLFIARQIIERMQGHIEVESDPGIGSTFRFLLPIAPVVRTPSRFPPPRQPDAEQADGRIPHILVAEDNTTNQVLLKALLQRRGWQVTVVDDGQEAVRACETHPYDAMLLDVQMPLMDGYEVAHTIRELEAVHGLRRLPIVGITAHAMAGDRERCLESGMDSYMSKPVEPKRLFQIVEQLLNRR